MPVLTEEVIHPGDTFDVVIPRVTIRGAVMTNTNPPSSFTFEVFKTGTSTGVTGSLTHSVRQRGSWIATVTAPGVAADDYEVRAVVTSPGGQRSWEIPFTVTAI
jgi:hypothetical protein